MSTTAERSRARRLVTQADARNEYMARYMRERRVKLREKGFVSPRVQIHHTRRDELLEFAKTLQTPKVGKKATAKKRAART